MERIRFRNTKENPNIKPRMSALVTILFLLAFMSVFLHGMESKARSAMITTTESRDEPEAISDTTGADKSMQDFLNHVNSMFASNKPKKERDTTQDFERALEKAYKKAYSTKASGQRLYGGLRRQRRTKFEVDDWHKRTQGGLNDTDRVALAEIYGQANSLFEYGLGESTYIADYLDMPRYAGVDSDPRWISMTRANVSNHFRFHFADIGSTQAHGAAQESHLPKNVLHYQLTPLNAEPEAFDVYLVDGRWRVPCMFVSFLHASARGANHQDTTVVLHDCHRDYYHHDETDPLFEIYHVPESKLCVYKRRPDTSNAMLVSMWSKYMDKSM
eukprot:CAMPEP_0172441414 /NCGR_PEP_ID=MMETSP1065-20121228/1970_1 /TAXON_ID=265537 /ORGANISM="Amphiprora paludosa, Strain CCMP125" /LENGTH=329 /DNA_ID=CAMNT_0013190777 /DNA_START=136 /DNA_END=1125 /DNA_ORIENTATION=-